jgi:hypothetical protein
LRSEPDEEPNRFGELRDGVRVYSRHSAWL